jgi:hypothetical protein
VRSARSAQSAMPSIQSTTYLEYRIQSTEYREHNTEYLEYRVCTLYSQLRHRSNPGHRTRQAGNHRAIMFIIFIMLIMFKMFLMLWCPLRGF